MGCNVFKGAFLSFHLDFFQKTSEQSAMSTESDFTRITPSWKNDTKARGFPAPWLIIAGHLEETFHRQNIAESHKQSHLSNVYTVCNIM
jgi:hypothetical protein